MAYVLAVGKRIDEKAERFGEQVDRIYRNPFEVKKQPQTRKEVEAYIVQRLIGKEPHQDGFI